MPAVLITGPGAMQNWMFFPQRWPKPSPPLTTSIQREIARLSGLDKYLEGRPIKGNQSQY